MIDSADTKLGNWTFSNLLSKFWLFVGAHVQEWSIIATFILALVLIYILYKPYNNIKNPTRTGYEHLIDANNGRTMSRTQMVNDVNRRRARASELSPVFPNGWIPILASKKLKKSQSVTLSVLGHDLAVFRGKDGKPYILNAYCPHLGANLGVGGKVKNSKCIECPFHGWTFDGSDGKCVSIPYSKSIPLSANTRAWLASEKSGFIFIWHHAENDPPSWQVPEVPEIEDGRWKEKATTEHTAFCHVQEIPENGADMAHFQHVHPEIFLSGNDLRTKDRFLWSPIKHKFQADWTVAESPNSHIANIALDTKVSIFGKDVSILHLPVRIQQIGPTLVYLFLEHSLLNAVFIQYVTPEGAFQHRITHAFFCDWRIPTIVGKIFLSMEAVQVERDIMIWNNKSFVKNPIIVKEDHLLAKYRRWYSQFYSANSPVLREVEERRLDW